MPSSNKGRAEELRIRPFSEIADPVLARYQIEEILLASAAPSALPRAAFLERWLDPYLRSHPDTLLLATRGDGPVLGVLNGCLDSGSAAVFRDLHPYYRLFGDLYADYPAHFHVNCDPGHRGKGIGSALIDGFVRLCRGARLSGLHLVTAPGARNVVFYRRNGFTDPIERQGNGRRYLFLGRRIG